MFEKNPPPAIGKLRAPDSDTDIVRVRGPADRPVPGSIKGKPAAHVPKRGHDSDIDPATGYAIGGVLAPRTGLVGEATVEATVAVVGAFEAEEIVTSEGKVPRETDLGLSDADTPAPRNVIEEGKRRQAQSAKGDTLMDWSRYTVGELVAFRDQIDRALPPTRLRDLNLEEQMLLQFAVIRELQTDVMDQAEENRTPANQLAQLANSVASSLKSLADYQVALYSSERFKDIENLMVRTLDKLPEELAAKFLEEYEKLLKRHA